MIATRNGCLIQTSDAHDMDHYTADLAPETARFELKNAIFVGHSPTRPPSCSISGTATLKGSSARVP
jgi:hypothetical protein